MTTGIKDKVVVITGASSGLGEATARHLAQHGAKLVLGARRLDRLQALARELSLGDEAIVRMDVTNRAEVDSLVKRAIEVHGRVDVMLNNAGLMPQAPLEKLDVADWDRMIDVNLKGVLYGIAAALPHMQRQKSGHFINVSSVAGHKVGPGFAVYAATKHAVRALSEGLRQEVKPYNHPHHGDLAGCRGNGTSKQCDRSGNSRAHSRLLCPGGYSRGLIRPRRGVRDQPAGRGGHKRNPVPPHPAGCVTDEC
jgi:NADP-dependent 3-hydroxy acid dehydrogenase YdfG